MASEAGHWYDKDGNPAYTTIGKNGVERPTTLRDAKKLGLVPSVTTIIRCAAAPGLENWKQDQAILAALTCPRIDGEDEASYLSRIKKDAAEQARKAAERGTQIHAWVQAGFEGKELPPDGLIYYHSAKKELLDTCGDVCWISENPFATPRYGGKCDLYTKEYLIDIKTTDKDITMVQTWPEHAMQLAAYDWGIGTYLRKCGILFINSLSAESRVIWVDGYDLEKGRACFNALLDYFYAKTGLEAA